jgi:hypothetical protein
MGYGARDQESVFPLDAPLKLLRDKYSHGLRQRIGGADERRAETSA